MLVLNVSDVLFLPFQSSNQLLCHKIVQHKHKSISVVPHTV